MGLLAWLLLGLIAGALARLIVPAPATGGGCAGLVVTIAIGLLGAVVGGFIGTQLGWGDVNSFDIRSILLAFLGAVVVLVIVNAVRRR